MTEESTRTLVERSKTGDRQAFDQLVDRLRSRVLSYVRVRLGSHLRDRVDAEDIVQETFLKAYQSIGGLQWRSADSFFGWLCGIAQNSIYKHSRRYMRVLPVDRAGDVPASGSSPSKHLRRNERFDRLEKALEALSPDHRQVITLSRMEGLPIGEVAKRMSRSPKAAYQLLWRALQKLKESFGDTESFHLPDRGFQDDRSRNER